MDLAEMPAEFTPAKSAETKMTKFMQDAIEMGIDDTTPLAALLEMQTLCLLENVDDNAFDVRQPLENLFASLFSTPIENLEKVLMRSPR